MHKPLTTGVTHKMYFGKAFLMCCLLVNRINFVQLLEPADHGDRVHRASSGKSITGCGRLGSRYGSSREVLAPASTPVLTPGIG